MIAITTNADGPEAKIDSRFGRCEWVVFYEPVSAAFSTQANSSREVAYGAGVNAAQFLADNGVDVLLTSHVGPKALQALQAAGITVYTRAAGTARAAIEAYQAGQLEAASEADVPSHYGYQYRGGH